ncbi:hypothetical protein V6N13_122134 [Hibiscus sabdariffa]
MVTDSSTLVSPTSNGHDHIELDTEFAAVESLRPDLLSEDQSGNFAQPCVSHTSDDNLAHVVDETIVNDNSLHTGHAMLQSDCVSTVAKRSSMFNDPIVEIQELTALIKTDITDLNSALSDLQTLQNMEISEGNYSEDRVVHSTTVFDDLKNKLMGATKHFQDNIKARENRKQIFSKSTTRENPFQRQTKSVTEPPPWSSSSNASESFPLSGLPSNGVQAGSQLRRRLAVDGTPSHHMEMSLLQQVVPRQEDYSQDRAVALQNVESTISELSGIFTHLATMVVQQGELAIRIDEDMDQSLANVEGARSALLRHLTRISSNRWLLIKIFAAIIFFLVIFIIFVA